MKKIALLFLTVLTLVSCSDEVQFNTPGFQANKNYNLWRATYFTATIDNAADSGRLTIIAGNNSEKMTIRLSSSAASTNPYLLTDTSFSKGDFIDFEGIEYSTSNLADQDVSLYPEIGEVVITESTPEYISGNFRFIAFTADGLKSVGFNEGDFYRIPINGGAPIGTVSCQQATTNLATATTSFSEVVPGDAQYAQFCNAYRTALQDALSSCGDTTGTLQGIMDGLGDCN